MARILFIENDLSQVNGVIKWLVRRGHDIGKAINVSMAEHVIRREQFDLIVLNFNLPKNDFKMNLPDNDGMAGGVYILKIMEEMNLFTPVIIFSGYKHQSIIDKLKKYNIEIPVILEKVTGYDDMDNLIDLIEESIENGRIQGERNDVQM